MREVITNNNFILDNLLIVISIALGRRIVPHPPTKILFANAKDFFGENFVNFYTTFIYPELVRYETIRVNTLHKMGVRCRIVVIFLIALYFFHMHYLTIYFATYLSTVFFIEEVFLICAIGWMFQPGITYQENVKTKIYPLLCKFLGDFKYMESPPITTSNVVRFGLLRTIDVDYSFSDLVSGTYKGVILRVVNLASTNQKRPFNGLLVVLRVNKVFTGKTLVLEDRGILMNSLVNVFQSNMQPVRLEDPIFESEFEVYSTDQVEARYLLSTSFMQRLLDLKASFQSKISCCFFEQELAILVSDITFFDGCSVFRPSNFENDIAIVLAQMQTIFGMIDNLKINEQNKL